MQQTEWDGFRSPKERAGTLPNSSLPPPDSSAEEALLARALRQRDEAAFDALLDRLHSPMLRLAQVFVRSREDAEEVVQDTWLAALGGIDRFQGRSSLKTWLFRILVYRARTRGKREARTVPFSAMRVSADGDPDDFREDAQFGEIPRAGTELFLSESMHRTRNGPEEQFLAAELRVQLEDAVRGLPPRQREVITLRDMEGWPADEVCELLGLSEANQRVLLHRARVRVRDAVAPYLGDDAADHVSRPTCCVRVSDRPPQRPPIAARRRVGPGQPRGWGSRAGGAWWRSGGGGAARSRTPPTRSGGGAGQRAAAFSSRAGCAPGEARPGDRWSIGSAAGSGGTPRTPGSACRTRPRSPGEARARGTRWPPPPPAHTRMTRTSSRRPAEGSGWSHHAPGCPRRDVVAR